jgi:hypothetical protein
MQPATGWQGVTNQEADSQRIKTLSINIFFLIIFYLQEVTGRRNHKPHDSKGS